MVLYSDWPYESLPEGPVEYGVDDRVDVGREVAGPEAYVDDVRRDEAGRAGGEDDVEDEEGGPAEDEGEKDETEDLGGLLLGGHHVRCHRLPLPPVCQEPAGQQIVKII